MLVARQRLQGFTLIELMITIVILAILTMAAAPTFREFVANQRVRNASFDLMAALSLARSQAITQSGAVNLQKSGGTWNAGWIVTDGTSIFSRQEPLPNLSITDTGEVTNVSYGKDGRITSTTTKFTIKPFTSMSGVTPRCIVIDLSGKPSSTKGACS